MVKHHCNICKREFSTLHGLTQHRNAKHHGRSTLSQTSEITAQRNHQQRSLAPEHDADLWNAPIIREVEPTATTYVESPVLQADVEMEDVTPVPDIPVIESRYNLRSRVQNMESEENIEEFEAELQSTSINLKDIDFDVVDL